MFGGCLTMLISYANTLYNAIYKCISYTFWLKDCNFSVHYSKLDQWINYDNFDLLIFTTLICSNRKTSLVLVSRAAERQQTHFIVLRIRIMQHRQSHIVILALWRQIFVLTSHLENGGKHSQKHTTIDFILLNIMFTQFYTDTLLISFL